MSKSLSKEFDRLFDADRNNFRQLPREYYRCSGISGDSIICDRRKSCLRYMADYPIGYKFLLPELTPEKPNCDEYIGE